MEINKNLDNNSSPPENNNNFSLNDDRRVKVLSPGALVTKRFLRNKVAVAGLITLILMFLFSFVGGFISPYDEAQLFYKTESMSKDFAALTQNKEFRFRSADNQEFKGIIQGQSFIAITKNKSSFTYKDTTYNVVKEGKDFYSISLSDGTTLGIAYKDIVTPSKEGEDIAYDIQFNALKAYTNNQKSFVVDGNRYTLDEYGIIYLDGNEIASISRYIVQAIMPDVFLSRDFKLQLLTAIEDKKSEFVFTDENGETFEYNLEYDPTKSSWNVLQEKDALVFDTYRSPDKVHPLGTDKNGMDMLTRLMYGGRVSLIIGFVVEFLAIFIGVILGGLSGYFGKWVDILIMRIVDVFYCIPDIPILIILGSMMDALKVEPIKRMLILMLLLGLLNWASVARLVRGQILSLREQDFMLATEACGISVYRRIFKHLIPNVVPQLIVYVTMGLGRVILTEATLSFLGLGVRFPFASWGNIINDVNDTYVLTNYLFIWIPAGVCILTTVLAFNLVGDGLRDAFDPRMNR